MLALLGMSPAEGFFFLLFFSEHDCIAQRMQLFRRSVQRVQLMLS
jgi:hypothetical protein